MTVRLDRNTPRAVAPPSPAPPAAPAAAAPAPADSFEHPTATTALGRLGEAIESLVEDRFLVPHDGFMAVGPDGAVHPGMSPSAVERDGPKFPSPMRALLHVLAGEEHGKALAFHAGGAAVAGRSTGREAEKSASLEGPLGAAVAASVDPRRGGLAQVQVESSDGARAAARVLVLPRDYDGPILVSDIDDTLRDTSVTDLLAGRTQPPMPGAREMLEGAAAMGVPIVYLSAGPTRIHDANMAFLAQLPQGILLDNRDFGLADLNPSNAAQARRQGAGKTAVLRKLRETYPNARLFGLGDDKYGDAVAYSAVGARAFIHDVKPDDANIPASFAGVKAPAWSPAVQQRLLGELRAAVDAANVPGPA